MRVTVYNTIGGNITYVETSATTWSGLQSDLDRAGIQHNGMSAVIGATQVTLESPAAVLPTSDFQLFLAPKKVKSGYDVDGHLVSFDGITWDEEDWSNENPEDFQFESKKDLTIARAKRAQFYLAKLVDYLINEEKKVSTDPAVVALQKTAQEIQRNLGLYD